MKTSARSGSAGVPFAAVTIASVFAAAAVSPGHASRTGALVAVAVIAAQLLHGRRLRRLDAAAGVFVAWITVSAFFSSDSDAARYLYWDLVAGALLFVAIRLSVEAGKHVAIVGGAFVAATVYMTLNLQPAEIRAPTATGSGEVLFRSTYGELNGNHVAYAMTVACFLLLVLTHGGRVWLVRVLAFAGAGALFHFGVRATDTRGAVTAVALMLALLPLSKVLAPVLRRLSLRLFTVGAVVLFVALSVGLLARVLEGRLTKDARETGTLNGRLEMWPRALESIRESPLAGKGPGTSMELNGGVAMHNALLDVMVDFGLVGLVLWGGVVLASVRATHEDTSGISYRVLAGTAMLAPVLLSGYWFSSAAAWGILGLMSTFSVLAPRGTEQREPAEPSATEERTSSKCGPGVTRRTTGPSRAAPRD